MAPQWVIPLKSQFDIELTFQPTIPVEAERFKPLWDLAGEALKSAGAVVILGYRMPPTDARSRRFLLENLPNARIPIHIVLGHDTNSPDTRRIKGLLEMARPQAVIEALPMFAQDYLDAYDPEAWDNILGSASRPGRS